MEIIVITLLILMNGLFALSETALVSSSKSKLETKGNSGSRGARTALNLLKKPEDFLSAIQIGITLVGIISGAYGGMQLSGDLAEFLSRFETLRPYSGDLSLILVVSLITYFSIVIGELVPKTFAMGNPEKIAEIMAPVIYLLTKITYPVVGFLSLSTRLILKIFFISKNPENSITEEELRIMIKMAGRDGVISSKEAELHQNMFRFFDRRGNQIMTHVSELTWLSVNDTPERTNEIIRKSSHSKFPVCLDSPDSILGIITIKDYVDNREKKNFTLRSILKPVTFIPENMSSVRILEKFKRKHCHFGIVIDDQNTVQGIITLHDLTENIFGNLPDSGASAVQQVVRQGKNSFIVDGDTQLDILSEITGITSFGNEEECFTTLAGFIMHKLERMPLKGDSFIAGGYRFEVTGLDGLKIDSVKITKEKKKKNSENI
ncbi:MAG TPA: hemolysin family protein [Spirochaetota bacterium]|mgnify:CR=1 FL=1|nr:hemolysin family protein [Spirochaetota bacterium]HPJ35614.1 hemolysin family protein [Spirochaetota bacterium]